MTLPTISPVRVALLAAALLALAPAAASGALSLTTAVDPSAAGTAQAPSFPKVTVAMTADPVYPGTNDSPAPWQGLSISFPAGTQLAAGAADPKCDRARVLARPATCTRGALVGSGTLTLQALGLAEPVTLTAYNAAEHRGVNILAVGDSPVIVYDVLPGVVSADGSTLAITVPPSVQSPAPGAVTMFRDMTLQLGGSSTWVAAPTCPTATWAFSATISGAGAPPLGAAATSPCSQGGPATRPPVLAAPVIASSRADTVLTSSVVLRADVTANGSDTTATFEYGPTTAYGSRFAVPAGAGGTVQKLATRITGLQRGRLYHFRVVATNGEGTVTGPDKTFRTLELLSAVNARLRVTRGTGRAARRLDGIYGVAGLPASTAVAVRCVRRCRGSAGFRSRTSDSRTGLRLRIRRPWTLPRGAEIEVRATRPDSIGRFVRLRFGASGAPSVVKRGCLTPGGITTTCPAA